MSVRPRRHAAESRLAGSSRADTAEMDHARVAQLEERGPCKTQVARSNRAMGTNQSDAE